MLKYLIYNYLQVALHRPSIKGSDRATRLPQRGLTALGLVFHWDSVLAPPPTTLRGTFASSMYLLPQRGGQNRLFCLRRWIHVCRSDLSAHVMQFLKGHGGRSWVFAPVIGFTCVNSAYLPLSFFIDIVRNSGSSCGKSPLSSGCFSIRSVLCRCSARCIAR